MKKLSISLIALALCCAAVATAAAQAEPAPAPVAPPAAQQPAPVAAPAAAPTGAPAAAPSADAPSADAPSADAPPSAAPQAAPPAVIGDPALEEQERQKREADRARIRLLLARARAERAALEQQGALPASAPQPEPVRHGDAGAAIAVGLSMELPWHTDTSYDLYSKNDVGQRYGLWATYDVLSLGEQTVLAAGAGFDVEQAEVSGLFGDALDTELTAVVLYGTAVLRYVPTDWFQPHARLSLGGQLVRSQLTIGGESYRSKGDLPFGSLGAGFTLRTPTRFFESRRGDLAALSFGIMVEGGYTLASSLDMEVDGPGPGGRDIALVESDLDDLDRSGPFMRISGVIRFF